MTEEQKEQIREIATKTFPTWNATYDNKWRFDEYFHMLQGFFMNCEAAELFKP